MNKNIEKEMKENQKFLEELLEAPSPTGYENAAVDVFNNHLSCCQVTMMNLVS